MAEFTSTQSGDWNQASTWGGAGVPGDGDTATIASGHTVTVTASTTVGASSGTKPGIRVQATDQNTYGKLVVSSGVTLTLKGVDTSSYPALLIDRYAKFEPASGAEVLIDCTSDYQTCIVNNGRVTADGATFGIPSSKLDWSNASGDQSLGPATHKVVDPDKNIYGFKMSLGSVLDSIPISNSAGDGLGGTTTSFTVVGTPSPSGVFATRKLSYEDLSAHGDYYIDHFKGIAYYLTTDTNALSVTYNYKYLSFYSSGIINGSANLTYNSGLYDNCTFNYLGAYEAVNHVEYTGGALMFRYKAHPAEDATKAMRVSGCTFNYCVSRAVQIYNSNGTEANKLQVTGNHFDNIISRLSPNFRGTLHIGYSTYILVDSNDFDSYNALTKGIRPTVNNIYVTNNTGSILPALLPEVATTSFVQDNNLVSFGGLRDIVMIEQEGAAGALNTHTDNTFDLGNRAARLGNYMVVERNKFRRCYHHGFVWRASDGYITGLTVCNNLVYESNSNGDMGGGFTFGYNRTHWLDDFVVANNTFDGGRRGLCFNDFESTKVLATRARLINNIFSNSYEGLRRRADDSSNISKLALARLDYNVDYNNTGQPSNVKQATFIKGGQEYNINTRDVAGVYLFDPSYSLPMGTGKTLQLVVSGTPGTDLACDLSWAGGTTQDLVLYQGTATGGTGASSHWTPGTIVKTGAGWTVNAYQCRYAKVISGTGAGQVVMIKSNTADTLTVLPNNVAGTFTGTDEISVFVIFESEVVLADGAENVHAGVYLPDLPLTADTYSDTGITIESHAQTGDPCYQAPASGDFHLLVGSSAIDVGTSIDLPADDLEGTTRTGDPDIGGLDYGGLVAKAGGDTAAAAEAASLTRGRPGQQEAYLGAFGSLGASQPSYAEGHAGSLRVEQGALTVGGAAFLGSLPAHGHGVAAAAGEQVVFINAARLYLEVAQPAYAAACPLSRAASRRRLRARSNCLPRRPPGCKPFRLPPASSLPSWRGSAACSWPASRPPRPPGRVRLTISRRTPSPPCPRAGSPSSWAASSFCSRPGAPTRCASPGSGSRSSPAQPGAPCG